MLHYLKETRMKNNSQLWFDGEIADSICLCDKLFKKFKKSRLHIDCECYKQCKDETSQ